MGYELYYLIVNPYTYLKLGGGEEIIEQSLKPFLLVVVFFLFVLELWRFEKGLESKLEKSQQRNMMNSSVVYFFKLNEKSDFKEIVKAAVGENVPYEITYAHDYNRIDYKVRETYALNLQIFENDKRGKSTKDLHVKRDNLIRAMGEMNRLLKSSDPKAITSHCAIISFFSF